MARLKSTSENPAGTILINPGGPGGVATTIIEAAAAGAPIIGKDIMDNYDVVGLDPRGVGSSTPVKCDPDLWNKRVSLFPTTEGEYKALVAYNTALGKSCAKLTGNLINHLSTLDVIEDMEMFRRAIKNENCKNRKTKNKTNGNDGLNFLGFSYGTLLATQYAEKYPENVNRFVLDGVVDHSLSETATLLGEATTFEASLNQFFLWCGTSSTCPLKGLDVAKLYDSLVQNATKTPIPAPGCQPTGENACFSTVTGEDIRLNTQSFVAGPYIESSWPILAGALAQAAQGNATLLSTAKATSETSSLYPFVAIGCQDWRHDSDSLANILAKTRMAAVMAPHTKGSTQSYWAQAGCIGWPAPVTNPQRPPKANVQKAPPMLLVNSLYDAETSISWAAGLAAQLPKSVLLTRYGAGHTSYLSGGEAQKIIDKFFVSGKLPAPGTTTLS
ncbi:hypothetical protein ABW20_dc0104657 [Dactylellina cionopaga]|nr:hypothetical protein ABW20_dc0104657 [Dactylellina cionopaga]